jgi:uncharacterized protein (TIGR03084 family)
MSDLLPGLLNDLEAEGDQLSASVDRLGADGWTRATPAPGWTVATTVAHLLWTDEVAVLAARSHDGPEAKQAWDDVVLAAINDPSGYVDAGAFEVASLPRDEVLQRWAVSRAALREALTTLPAGQRMPWFGPPMGAASMATARFMETWAHALDVYDAAATALGQSRPAPTDRIRHVAHLGVRTRNYSYSVHEEEPPAEEFRVELTAPSGELWTWGPEDEAAPGQAAPGEVAPGQAAPGQAAPGKMQSVRGSAYDFCLLATQRVHRADTDLVAVGDDAEHWLGIVQAFAGPPGSGREATA